MSDPLLPCDPSPTLLRENLPTWIDPLDALEGLRGQRHVVLLLSGPEGHPGARFSILAADPFCVAALRGQEARFTWAPGAGRPEERRRFEDGFEFLRAIAPAGHLRPAPGLPFAGGAIGYLGYGLRRSTERLPALPPDPLASPEAWFGLYDRAVVFDHAERRISVVSIGLSRGASRGGGREESGRLAELRSLLEAGERRRARPAAKWERPPGRALLRTARPEYLRLVRRALAYIAAGDIYQVNLSHRIESPFDGDPVDLFRALAEMSPAPFAAYLDAGEFRVLSASPERFVRARGDRATSSPIKGTRPRGRTKVEDARLARDLVVSSKDRAENIMIADLVRNDLGRVCVRGSVRVLKLCGLESFATVHHLVSTIEGRLRPDRDRIDLLRALFPGGSMTGAPKIRAMEVIGELEGEERGIYAGSIGYLSCDGGLDFNIAIRTIVCAGGRAHLRVGGAIVADSDPEAEFQETMDKARALLEVLGADFRRRG